MRVSVEARIGQPAVVATAMPLAPSNEAGRQIVNKRYLGKTVLVTGAASGIGRAVAVKFGGQGWFVGLADIDEAGMRETAAKLPAGASSLHRVENHPEL